MLDPTPCFTCSQYELESLPIDLMITPYDPGRWLGMCELLCLACPHCEPATT